MSVGGVGGGTSGEWEVEGTATAGGSGPSKMLGECGGGHDAGES